MDAFPWQDVRKACAAGDQAALETIVSGAANCDPSLLLPRAFHCAWEQGQRQLCKWILERSWRECLLEAFNDGDLPKVQWLYKRVRKHFCDDKDDQMFRFVQACTKGHLHLAQWVLRDAVSLGLWDDHDVHDATATALSHACGDGRLHVVQWLKSLLPDEGGSEYLYAAACEGHLRVVQWLCAVNDPSDDDPDDPGQEDVFHDDLCVESAFLGACMRGHYTVARWFIQRYPEWGEAWDEAVIRRLQTWSASRDAWMRAVVCAAIH
jgi:hypothetical protein